MNRLLIAPPTRSRLGLDHNNSQDPLKNYADFLIPFPSGYAERELRRGTRRRIPPGENAGDHSCPTANAYFSHKQLQVALDGIYR